MKNKTIYIGVDLNSRNIDIAATEKEIPLRIVEHVLPIISRARIREPSIINTIDNIYVAHIYTVAPSSNTYYVNITVSLRILKTLLKELAKISITDGIPVLCIENLCSIIPYRRNISIVEKISDIFISKILEKSRLVDTIAENPLKLKKRTSIWGLVYVCKRYRTGIVIIDPYLTSRLCSLCLYNGSITLCRLTGRYVNCPIHGKVHRDINAAVNIALLCRKALEPSPPPAGPSLVPRLHGDWWGFCRRMLVSVGLGDSGLVAGGGQKCSTPYHERAGSLDRVSLTYPENMSSLFI